MKTAKQLAQQIADLQYKLTLVKEKKSKLSYESKIKSIMEELPIEQLLQVVRLLQETYDTD